MEPTRRGVWPSGRHVLGALAFALPLLVWPSSLSFFELPKAVALQAGVLALTGMLALRLAAVGARSLRVSRPLIAIVGFGAWAALSTALSIHVPTAVVGSAERAEGLLTLVAYVALALAAVQLVRRFDDLYMLAGLVSLSGILVTGYALVQAGGFDMFAWEMPFGPGRPFATLANPDFLGGFLALVWPLAAAGSFERPPRAGERGWVGASLTCVLAGFVIMRALATARV
ncbi:MAG: hypothetical protein FDZ70_02330, partial [Actinobacteria bacterium]